MAPRKNPSLWEIMEERVTFLSENYQIEGLLYKNSLDHGVVITHPHPLYGGDMHNFIVDLIARTYQNKDFTTLRFNFRGTGKSQGSYADGTGEQLDVVAALSTLQQMGIKIIDLAGYSFGAWVNALAIDKCHFVRNMVMVSPPVGFVDFSPVNSIPNLKLVVTGSMDDIAPADRIETMSPKWNPKAQFKIITGADHFYSGCLDELASVLSSHI
ncbi:MAG: alpha/beta fold hydrolase [Desulfobacterales bacterium]|nr:alpha/beta fold hydrolase [Deltaproteobacteria bacterium]NNL42988.1 alpha/beta fold hydrolase [Desulfobacterales bacterium]